MVVNRRTVAAAMVQASAIRPCMTWKNPPIIGMVPANRVSPNAVLLTGRCSGVGSVLCSPPSKSSR